MAEERVTEVETPTGDRHTHTTVITDGDRGGGGGATLLIVLLVIVLAGVAIWFFAGSRSSEITKDNAVAAAANDVGNAAQNVGEAAKDAADNATR
jgi:uncharacterized protein HemX